MPDNPPDQTIFNKLPGFQALIPQFDSSSTVTPKYFLDILESITTAAKCAPEEKLMVLKSRIRGDALTHIINSPDLSQESNYPEFKKKFLAYFDTPVSLATRQQQFSNCRMLPNESVKIYAARVANATQKFFGNIDTNNTQVKALLEQTKLSKFIDGLASDFKRPVLTKDPQTFQEALNFVEMLQTNEANLSNPLSVGNICPVNNSSENEGIRELLLSQQEIVANLTKELANIKLASNNSKNIPTHNFSRSRERTTNSHNNNPNHHYNPSTAFNNNNRARFPPCRICSRRNHSTAQCFYAASNRDRRQQRNPPFLEHNRFPPRRETFQPRHESPFRGRNNSPFHRVRFQEDRNARLN